MSVIKCQRLSLPSGGDTPDAAELTAKWLVQCDSVNDGNWTCLAFNAIPKLGDAWNADGTIRPAYRCVDRQAGKHPSTSLAFEVTLTFSTKYDAVKMEAKELKPLDRRPRVTTSSQEREEELYQDQISDKLILNSAGDQFLGLKRVDRLRIYAITLNVDSYPTAMLEAEGLMNTTAITIYGETWERHQVLIKDVKVSEAKFENDQAYYEASAQFLCTRRTVGHKQKVLDAGLYEKVSGLRRRCLIGEREVDQPVPLANGVMIPILTLLANPITAPDYKTFADCEETDFDPLGLPSSPPF